MRASEGNPVHLGIPQIFSEHLLIKTLVLLGWFNLDPKRQA